MRKYDAVIFDFDGTIADTVPGIAQSIMYALSTIGIEVKTLENPKRFVGPPIRSSFEDVFGIKGDDLEKVIVEYREHYASVGAYNSELYDGLLELFEELYSNGIKMAIASAKNQGSLENLLKYFEIDRFFESVNGIVDAMNPTTKTQNMEKTLLELGCKPEKTVMIGDRFFDAEASEEIGIDFIIVRYSDMAPLKEFDGFKRVLVAEEVKDISEFIL